jgi:WD40 repeat protein
MSGESIDRCLYCQGEIDLTGRCRQCHRLQPAVAPLTAQSHTYDKSGGSRTVSGSGDVSSEAASPPSKEAQPGARRLSRRKVLLGLVGGGLLLSGGALGRLIYILNYQHARYIYRGHTGGLDEVHALAWSPTSQRVASGADNLQVWDALSGAHIQKFPARGGVEAVAWSPDGKYLASGNGDGTVTVWEVATGKQLLIYSGHVHTVPSLDVARTHPRLSRPLSSRRTPHSSYLGGVLQLQWSPDGTLLLSSGPDDTAQVWEALTGRTLLTLGSRGALFVQNAVWAPDGRQIAGRVLEGVHFWDAISGTLLSTSWKISSVASDGANAVDSLAWSPNGRYLAAAADLDSGSETLVVVWEAATGRNVMLYRGHTDTVFVAAWSPDSRRLASAGRDMTVHVWEATTGQTEYIYRGHMGFWQQYFSARTSQAPVQASGIILAHPGTQVAPLEESASLLRSQDSSTSMPTIFKVAWSPDGQYIASGGLDQDMTATVQVWQPE